jgi:hypothetical protein
MDQTLYYLGDANYNVTTRWWTALLDASVAGIR